MDTEAERDNGLTLATYTEFPTALRPTGRVRRQERTTIILLTDLDDLAADPVSRRPDAVDCNLQFGLVVADGAERLKRGDRHALNEAQDRTEDLTLDVTIAEQDRRSTEGKHDDLDAPCNLVCSDLARRLSITR